MPQLLPYVVEVETDRPAFPQMCVCCCGAAETIHHPEPPQRRPGMPGGDEPISLPYCEVCLAHMKASLHLGLARVVALNIAVWGLAVPLIVGAPPPFLAAGPGIAAGYLFHARRTLDPFLQTKEICSASGKAMKAIWYRRTTYFFSFASEKYAEAFKELNEAVLSKRED